MQDSGKYNRIKRSIEKLAPWVPIGTLQSILQQAGIALDISTRHDLVALSDYLNETLDPQRVTELYWLLIRIYYARYKPTLQILLRSSQQPLLCIVPLQEQALDENSLLDFAGDTIWPKKPSIRSMPWPRNPSSSYWHELITAQQSDLSSLQAPQIFYTSLLTSSWHEKNTPKIIESWFAFWDTCSIDSRYPCLVLLLVVCQPSEYPKYLGTTGFFPLHYPTRTILPILPILPAPQEMPGEFADSAWLITGEKQKYSLKFYRNSTKIGVFEHPPSEKLQSLVLEDLNRLIQNRNFGEEPAFARYAPPQSEKPRGDKLVVANRQLLDAALADEFNPCDTSGMRFSYNAPLPAIAAPEYPEVGESETEDFSWMAQRQNYLETTYRDNPPASSRVYLLLVVAIVSIFALWKAYTGSPHGDALVVIETEAPPRTVEKPPQARAVFPDDENFSLDRYAVFIGIDKYDDLTVKNLVGSVNDATKLQQIFADGFGFQRHILLTDDDATQSNIRQSFRALLGEIAKARQKIGNRMISVVLTYSGHDAQVRDQNSDEMDGKDETWYVADSQRDGSNIIVDIVDDEINALLWTLVRLNCQVLLISDSAGTLAEQAPKTEDILRQFGDALPEFPSTQQSSAGFVALTACEDSQHASVTDDESGEPCGRLTYSLREVLPQAVQQKSTYAEIFERVLEIFHRRFPAQTPQCYYSGDTLLRVPFDSETAALPTHVDMLAYDTSRQEALLNVGSIHGIAPGVTLSLFKNTTALKNGAAFGTAQVVETTPFVCKAKLAELPEPNLFQSARARLQDVKFPGLTVSLDENLPLSTLAQIPEHFRRGENFDLRFDYDRAKQLVRISLPENLSGYSTEFAAADIAATEIGILSMAQIHHLMALRQQRDAEITLAKVSDPTIRGQNLEARVGEELQLLVNNLQDNRLWIYVVAANPPNQLQLVYPTIADQGIVPGKQQMAVLRYKVAAANRGKSMLFKVIASRFPIPLRFFPTAKSTLAQVGGLYKFPPAMPKDYSWDTASPDAVTLRVNVAGHARPIAIQISGDFDQKIISPVDKITLQRRVIGQLVGEPAAVVPGAAFASGTYQLRIQHNGYEDLVKEIDIPVAKEAFVIQQTLTSKLRKIIFKIVSGSGTPLNPDEITINEKPVDPENTQLRPGSYRLLIRINNYEPVADRITIAALDAPYILEKIFPLVEQPGQWPPALWRVCWNGEYIDFTDAAWAKLPASEQGRLAGTYQKWFAAKQRLPVEQDLYAGCTTLRIVLIPPGKFMMGSPESEPGRRKDEKQHPVVISKAFWLGKYEITQEQWTDVTGEQPWLDEKLLENRSHPAAFVSWQDISNKFVAKLGQSWSLPTEAQWEYACRAGTLGRFYWGEDELQMPLYENTSFAKNGSLGTAPVGKLRPNGFGLHDMIGNFRELCSDDYGDYPTELAIDPVGSNNGKDLRVQRGGSWPHDNLSNLRAASRSWDSPVSRLNFAGGRVVLNVLSPEPEFVIASVVAVDEHKQQKSVFYPGEKVYLRLRWRVEEGAGEKYTRLSVAGEGIKNIKKRFTKTKAAGFIYYPELSPTRNNGEYQVEVSLQIGIKIRTRTVSFSVIELAPQQPEDWPLSLWQECWNLKDEYVDFTTNTWRKLSHDGQVRYARSYQQWYGKYKRLAVSKQVSAGKSSIEMMLIPPGKFSMGSLKNEKNRSIDERRHAVLMSKHYYIGKYEVTQQQWRAVMRDYPAHFKGKHNPVEQIDWNRCVEFCHKLGGQLPTEAQWEYACRAGTTRSFNLGDDIDAERVNYDGNYPYRGNKGVFRQKTVAVGSLSNENSWGCYDFHGNVYEWCSDWYKSEYIIGIANPNGPNNGSYRVRRGGSWYHKSENLRSANRSYSPPSNNFNYFGFRFCKSD